MQPGAMTRPTTLKDNASSEATEDPNHDRVVWNVEDEEESPESPVEDRDKTITTTWDVMELDANTTFLQGETIDRGGA